MNNCNYCKKIFALKRSDAKYCSHSCRQLAYVLRKAKAEVNNETTVINIIQPVHVTEQPKKGIINRFIEWLWKK